MEFKDLFITPAYLLLILGVAFAIRKKLSGFEKKIFIPALTLKITGAVVLGLIYFFYYKGGDTINFYNLGTRHIYNAFIESPLKGIKLLIEPSPNTFLDLTPYTSKIYYYTDSSSYFIVKLAAFFSLFCFHTYTVMAIGFAVLSFCGSWALFTSFSKIYPNLKKKAALAIFLTPSIFFWGSGLIKDSITFAAVGLIFYAFTNLLIFRRKILFSTILLILSFYVLMIVKIYILICLVPGLILWLFFHFNYLIKSNFLRNLLKPLVLILSVGIGFVAMRTISSESSRYSLDSITHTMQETAWWLAYMSQLEGGSYYSLGDIEYTTTGLLKKMPAAVNVTLFRPYLWEAKNVVMILSAIESFTLLLLTLYILFWKPGIRKSFKIIANDPFVLFSVIFSISFAFAIGISTYNFGSLVRYKIPLLPFYILALAVIHSYAKKKRSGRQQSFSPPVTTPENNEHDIEDQWII